MTGTYVDPATSPWKVQWDSEHPCLICLGHPDKQRVAQRCSGGLRADGGVAYCTVREAEGKALAHRLGGSCGCGIYHPALPSGNGHGHDDGVSGDSRNGFHHGPDGLPAFSDTRNALRLVERHGERIRKDFTRGKKGALLGWRIWDGRRWALDEIEAMMVLSKEVVNHLPEEIPDEVHPKTIDRLRKDCLACEQTGRLTSLISNAGSLVPTTHADWDADPYLLNVRNGTVDLRTGELLEHRPERYLTKLAPFDFDPDMPTPVWSAFLDRIFAGDSELIAFVQRAVGLSLVGKVCEHVLFVQYGGGANGKTTLTNIWLEALGDYAREASMDLFGEHTQPQHPTTLAELGGVRYVAVGELRNQRFDEGLVKALTGGEARNARWMFQDSFTYIPTDTFWLSTNHKPTIVGNSEGIWRRIRLIPFGVQIPDSEQDTGLPDKLRREYGGILAWAVRGCTDWLAHGLGHASAVDGATAVYRGEMDTMAAFLGERCVIGPDEAIGASDLYKGYEAWCTESGEKAASQRFLGIRLGERGFRRERLGHTRRWHWLGIRLRDDGGGDGDDSRTPPYDPYTAPDLFSNPAERVEESVENSPAPSDSAAEGDSGGPIKPPDSRIPESETLQRRSHVPIDPIKARERAVFNSDVGMDTTRVRAHEGVNGKSVFMDPPEINEAVPRDRTHKPVVVDDSCDRPVLDSPPGGPDRCPECSSLLHHRVHLGHWDHDCQRSTCNLRFRTA